MEHTATLNTTHYSTSQPSQMTLVLLLQTQEQHQLSWQNHHCCQADATQTWTATCTRLLLLCVLVAQQAARGDRDTLIKRIHPADKWWKVSQRPGTPPAPLTSQPS
jgi:hypothetical protein